MVAHARTVNIFKDNKYPYQVVHSLETKYPVSDSPEDIHAAFLEDAISIRFLLEATYLGRYTDDLLAALDEICAAQNASYDFLEADYLEMEKASHRNDWGLTTISAISVKLIKDQMKSTITAQVKKGHLFIGSMGLPNAFISIIILELTGIGWSIRKGCMTC